MRHNARKLTFMLVALLLALVVGLPTQAAREPALAGSVRAFTLPDADPVPQEIGLPETLRGIPGARAGWWAAVQEEIRQSEYHVTWQERTYLDDVVAAYQAPNRAHNLRTYFTPQGIRLIPRLLAGETPPWELSLALSGYGFAEGVQPVAAAVLSSEGNRIEYRRGDPATGSRQALSELYLNYERGLTQGFTLSRPPAGDHRSITASRSSDVVLELAISGDLTPNLAGDGAALEFTTQDGVRVLRLSDLAVYDADAHQLPARLVYRALPNGQHVLRMTFDTRAARYPLTVASTITGLSLTPNWTAEGDQEGAEFGRSVGTARDVNGDGCSDVIVGVPYYDAGQARQGRVYVYHGSAAGLSASPTWTATGEELWDELGIAVGTAGDVNGDGYSDVVVGARVEQVVAVGRAYVYHGSAGGLSASPAWTAEGDQEWAEFGSSLGM